MNLLFILDWTIFIPITLIRLLIIYFYGSKYNINGLKFLDVMLHADNIYFNQNFNEDPPIDTISKDIRHVIKYDSYLYQIIEVDKEQNISLPVKKIESKKYNNNTHINQHNLNDNIDVNSEYNYDNNENYDKNKDNNDNENDEDNDEDNDEYNDKDNSDNFTNSDDENISDYSVFDSSDEDKNEETNKYSKQNDIENSESFAKMERVKLDDLLKKAKSKINKMMIK